MRTPSREFLSDGTSSVFGVENLCDKFFDQNLYASILGVIPTNGAGWTAGGTTIAPVTLPPPGSTGQIKIFSYTVNAQLILKGGGGHLLTGGKLGFIRAGLTQLAPTNTPFSNPFLPYPVDMSLITDLFDPANDNLPPFNPGGSVFTIMKVSATNVLPTPLLLQGMIYNMGIWMEPSLLGALNNAASSSPGIEPTVCNATWSLSYALEGDPDF